MSKEENKKEELLKENESNELVEVKEDVSLSSNEDKKEEKRLGEKEESVVKYDDIDEKKRKKRRLIIFIVIGVILALIILFSVIVCINKLNGNVYKNVKLFGQDIGGMTKDQVNEIITKVNDEIKEKKLPVYQDSDELYSVVSSEIDFNIDVAKTLNNVMGFGRDNNIFKNNFKIIAALFKPVDIDVCYSYDNQKLETLIKNIDLTIKDRALDDSYSIDEKNGKLIITRGKSGNAIDYKAEKEKIISSLKDLKTQKIILDIKHSTPQELDVQKVYSEVKREAKDAYVDEKVKPVKFVSEVIGLDFDVAELEQVLNNAENKQEGKVIEFPLKVTQPKVKLADITGKYYNDKIAGKTTYFDASQSARANNLNVALKSLNGKIIMPGEVFSYNAAIGDTTASKGYQAAATFKGGTVVNEMGGGICQTTSTLYDAVLMANLEIVERHQHGLPVGYVQPSLDATVYSPVLDFKFKNTRNYPVKIVTSFSYGGNMNVSIYGTKEDNEYDITLSSKVINKVPFTTKYIYDNNMYDGKQVIEVKGVDGYVSEGYITRSQNGKVVSSKLLSRDTYNAQQQVVRVGTKKAAS